MRRSPLPLVLCTALAAAGCGSSGGARPRDGGAGDGAQRCGRAYPELFRDVCLTRPTATATRTQCGEIVEFCDTSGRTSPNLACWSAPREAAPAGPKTVTLAGYVDVFSSGPDADGLAVEVYRAADLEKALAADLTAGKVGPKYFPSVKPIGTDTVALTWTDRTKPPVDATRGPARACPKDRKKRLPCAVPTADCGAGGGQKYCDLKGDQYCYQKACLERLRWEVRYRIPGVPTNTPLVVRVRGKGGFDDGTWGVMLEYNVYLRADAAPCKAGEVNDCMSASGQYEMEVSALSRADYATIPITAGLPGGIPAGHGAVAGEVRDCDGIRISSAQVGTRPTPEVVVYFNGNPVKTLPVLDRGRQGSNADGIFSALDIVPGPVQVRAAALVGGKLVAAGEMKAAVFPDSVTVVGLDRPNPKPATP